MTASVSLPYERFSELAINPGTLIGLFNQDIGLEKQPFFLARLGEIRKGHAKNGFNIVYDSLEQQAWNILSKNILGLWIPNMTIKGEEPSITVYKDSGNRPYSITHAYSGIPAITEAFKRNQGLDFYASMLESGKLLSLFRM